MRRKAWVLVSVFVVLVVASWILAEERSVNMARPMADSDRMAPQAVAEALLDRDVLFGSYGCRVAPGVQIQLETHFSSTGSLVPAPAAGAADGLTYHLPVLKTENVLLGDVSFAHCESFATSVEQQLTAMNCVVGSRETTEEFLGIRYVCQGTRNQLINVIGRMGRAVLSSTF